LHLHRILVRSGALAPSSRRERRHPSQDRCAGGRPPDGGTPAVRARQHPCRYHPSSQRVLFRKSSAPSSVARGSRIP